MRCCIFTTYRSNGKLKIESENGEEDNEDNQ